MEKKSKEQRKQEARRKFECAINSAWKKYLTEIDKIDKEEVSKNGKKGI